MNAGYFNVDQAKTPYIQLESSLIEGPDDALATELLSHGAGA